MKKITFLLLLVIPLISFSQTKEKNARDTFEVSGNCDMCKKRIESATLSLKGVKYVSWSPQSKNFSIIYNSTKVSIDDVVIICTYGSYDETEAKTHIPTLVYFDKSNNVTKVKNTIPEQKLKSV